jgi:5-amino-6-(5-phosphoribosylamino)uracil reductase
MPERPYTILSCSISLDGYLGGATEERLVLSNDADLARVDRVRAECDAILVGAGTVRDDNPRLLVRDPALREQRRARGLAESPAKVTMTRHAQLDAGSNFFATGDSEKIVYCPSASLPAARGRLSRVATVVDGGQRVEVGRLTEDLFDRGVRRLMVEGGGRVHTQFLTAAAADELHLVVAPFFVGSSQARRFVGDGAFPWNAGHRARLAETRQIGDVVLLRYALSPRFEEST